VNRDEEADFIAHQSFRVFGGALICVEQPDDGAAGFPQGFHECGIRRGCVNAAVTFYQCDRYGFDAVAGAAQQKYGDASTSAEESHSFFHFRFLLSIVRIFAETLLEARQASKQKAVLTICPL
jgi:hypothetical protein